MTEYPTGGVISRPMGERKTTKIMGSTEYRHLKIIYGIMIAIVACVIVACVSCKTPQPIVQTVEKERIVEVHTRDTAIVTEADSASIKALLHCDSAFNVVIDELATEQGKRLKAEAKAKNAGKNLVLQLDCKEDSLINEIQLRDSIINNFEKETVVVKERYIPDYYKNTSVGFWILLAILVVIVGFKVYRLWLKIQSGGLIR